MSAYRHLRKLSLQPAWREAGGLSSAHSRNIAHQPTGGCCGPAASDCPLAGPVCLANPAMRTCDLVMRTWMQNINCQQAAVASHSARVRAPPNTLAATGTVLRVWLPACGFRCWVIAVGGWAFVDAAVSGQFGAVPCVCVGNWLLSNAHVAQPAWHLLGTKLLCRMRPGPLSCVRSAALSALGPCGKRAPACLKAAC